MNLRTRRVGLTGIGLAIVAAVAADTAWYVLAQAAAGSAARENARCQDAWRKLVAAETTATEAGAAAVEAELDQAESRLAELAAALIPSPRPETVPAAGNEAARSGADTYFALSGFVRRMREQAQTAGVGLRANEQFGFSRYAHEGPGPDAAAAVDAQRHALEVLLPMVWAAQPRRFEGVQRTAFRSARPAAQTPAAAGAPEGASTDVLARESFRSLAEPRTVETDAYRVTFVGRTAALRRFLNAIVISPEPLVVREVAAEPLKESAPRSGRAPTSGDSLVPVVQPAWHRFAVTVERWTLAGPIPERSSQGPAPVASAVERWPEGGAPPDRSGREYDLFTPPSIFRDPRRGTIIAAGAAAGAGGAEGGFDLELLAVRHAPFRWQLAGYAGTGGGLRGIFADAEGGGAVVAGKGDRLGAAEWEVTTVAIARAGGSGDDGSTAEPETAAVLRDPATGEQLTLTNRLVCRAGALVGMFRSRKNPELRCELGEGRSVALDGADFCVKRLELHPPQAVVSRVTSGAGTPAVLVLTPSGCETNSAPVEGPEAAPAAGHALSLSP